MAQVQASWAQLQVPEPQPMDKGCPPGSLWFTFPAAPVVGAPYRCTHGCPTMTAAPGGMGPVTPRQYRWRSGLCRPLVDPFTPPGKQPDYGSPVFGQAAAMLARWQAQV